MKRLSKLIRVSPILGALLWGQQLSLPTQILYIDPSTRDTFATATYLSRTNPIVVEFAGSILPRPRRDTIFLTNQGSLSSYRSKFYEQSGNSIDSVWLRVTVSYPSTRRTEFTTEVFSFSTSQWVRLLSVVQVGASQAFPEILSTAGYLIAALETGYTFMPIYMPPMYKRAHYGDTIYMTHPLSPLSDIYARKPGSANVCDSLIPINSSDPIQKVSLCFNAQGLLTQSRLTIDNSSSDDEEETRNLVYDAANRVLRDSIDNYLYSQLGTSIPNSHSRRVLRYTYDAQGRLSEIFLIEIYKQGGFISRFASLPKNHTPSHLRRTNSQDTTLTRLVFIYGSAASVESALSAECLVISGRRGTLGCLSYGERVSLSLYDLMGREFWRGDVSGEHPTFHLPESLPQGVYLLRVGNTIKRLYLLP
ncbi:MAG: hypothetical protein N2253_03335 [Bacteroidia bacterium]|nr:hypothetical protein [Bacteroidia bacterium]MDW8057820.1 hypothetical protein [Bacteroidia bacterium]